jgi:catechol 2,3-dioxygenase-like lactoylglutathione lyase family enzyme
MYDHIGFQVKDLAASIRFYQSALAGLGHVLSYQDETSAGFGPPDAPALWLYAAKPAAKPAATGLHVAFQAADHQTVDRFHKDGLTAGGRDNGAPGLRKDYSPTYYAAFLFDPDGNNVEAVCLT